MRPPADDPHSGHDEPTDDESADHEPTPLDVATLALRTDERGRLYAATPDADANATANGPVDAKTGARPGEVRIIARRAFPWSKPDTFISLRTSRGVEVALLESLDQAPAPARALIARFLADATFTPKITRVDRVRVEHGYQQWDVQAEPGPLELRVQEREDVRFLTETRLSVKDAHGNVFEIPDVRLLDAHSQRELAKIM